MEIASLTEQVVYNDTKPAVTVLLKTKTSKEIRIAMKAGQIMKEHKAPFPIVVEVFEGQINFGINNEVKHLKKGDLIALEANVPHDLESIEPAIIRLSISVLDSENRVKNIIN